ncbi:MAG: GntR family transcriptional regulator [bacterium]|nr:GntR family transcriptional regulator [bacterium]
MAQNHVYEGIKRSLKTRIESGDLEEGAFLPSEQDLVDEHGVSRNQARQALRELELEGYILRSQGRRSVVAAPEQRRHSLSLFGTKTIAIALPMYFGLFPRDILGALASRLNGAGYQTVVYDLKVDATSEVEFLKHLRASGAGGSVVWLQCAEAEETVEALHSLVDSGFPFILIDRYVPGLEVDSVVSDNDAIGYHLTTQLLDRGHESIGFVTRPGSSTSGEDRYAGHCRALKEAGLPVLEEYRGDFNPEDGKAQGIINEIVALREAPTAFLCTNDYLAEVVITQLLKLGYDVPKDFEVAAVDDEHHVDALGTPIMAVRQRAHDIGVQAAEVLLARMDDPSRPPDRRVLPFTEIDPS